MPAMSRLKRRRTIAAARWGWTAEPADSWTAGNGRVAVIRVLLPVVAAMSAGVLAPEPAGAETEEQFYRGKTKTMVDGTAVVAGAVSAYPTATAPVIKKYILAH